MMVFNRKADFFLDLGSEGAQPAQVAVKAETPQKQPAAAATAKTQTVTAQTVSAQTVTAQPVTAQSAPSGDVLTTAEAIAAELRAAQEAKPAASLSTFAPDCLNPANAVPTRRRRGGANLAGFKAMASGMFRS